MPPTLKSLLKFIRENTFILSILSIALCGLAYLYQVFELRKWEIPLGMVDGMETQYLLVIVIGACYCFSAAYMQEYMQLKFNLYVPSYITNNFIRKTFKRMCKQFPTEKDSNAIKEIMKVERECNNLRHNIAKSIFIAVLMSFICFFPFYALFFVVVLNTSMPSVFLFYSITIAVSAILAYYFNSKQIRKEIHKAKVQLKDNNGTYTTACEKISSIESKRLETLPRNTPIMNNLTVPITSVVMFFICMMLSLYSSPPKDYWIYTDDSGNNFASVFELGESSILKRAIIENEEITIFLDEQMRLGTADKPMQRCSFEKVIVKKSGSFQVQN